MRIAGVDLAWGKQRSSGVCIGKIFDNVVRVTEIYPTIDGVAKILDILLESSDLCGITNRCLLNNKKSIKAKALRKKPE